MSYWIREIAGWLLVLAGLYAFYICLLLLLSPAQRIVSAAPIMVIGIFIFRGGIHLLKVAVAARICLQAQKQLEATTVPVVRSGPRNQ